MTKQHIEELLQAALAKVQAQEQTTFAVPSIQIDTTKDKQHGDFASNIALILAKQAHKKPRDLAHQIIDALPPSSKISKVEIAGPGFINFFLTSAALQSILNRILAEQDDFGKTNRGQGQKILVEFVSSNPTGPLHVGHGRHAACGAVISNLLTAQGYQVHREYYVNDAGRQMDIIAVSVWLRYLAHCGENITFPANGYQGDYVITIAAEIFKKYAQKFCQKAQSVFENLPIDEPQGGDKEIYIDALIDRAQKLLGATLYGEILAMALEMILKDIKEDLEEFGVYFDEWFSERQFVQTGVVDRVIDKLKESGHTYEREGALWFRSTDFNDEKDRVLQRKNGQRTYFANDLAYHIHKFTRGFDQAIDIFGSDHHGYIPRMKAGLIATGIAADKLKYLLLQFVKLYRGSELVPMSTRSGSFVTLRELRKEVGNDAARFFYVMRKNDQHVDFDLDLAKSQSNENPVYYIQYAHARICSVFRQLAEKNLSYDENEGQLHLPLLTHAAELHLIGTLSRYQDVISNAVQQLEPSILTLYLRELATGFHSYYNSMQFIVEDTNLRQARLTLIKGTRQVIANGLKLLGVSAPENM